VGDARVEWVDRLKYDLLKSGTVARLKAAHGGRAGLEAILRRYLELGHQLGASPEDLWESFAIRWPNIPERAGYDGDECEQLVALFDRLSRERFGGSSPGRRG
jgi:hypothetical protein